MTFEPDNNFDSGVVIRVIGIGGGGNNAVNRMIASNVRGVEFVAINTDRQALRKCDAPTQMVIGEKITRGFGAGANPEIGARAAEESIDAIKQMLSGADLVFITAGMGGGTGTGAAPIVARVAREMGILTIGIVTKPFSFEGKRRMAQAEKGIKELGQYVDSLVIVPNEKLNEISDGRIAIGNAFEIADDVLRRGVESVSKLINEPGLINLDFADVSTVMRNAGFAHMGIGGATGPEKAVVAAEAAISSPMLETSIDGARGIIISVMINRDDVVLDDVYQASAMISEHAHPDAHIIWGLGYDDSLKDEMRITVIATGFEEKKPEPLSAPVAMPVAEPVVAVETVVEPEEQEDPAPVAPASEEQAAPAAEPEAAAPAAPAVEPVQSHAPKYDAVGEDSSISEDDFDTIMSIFRNRARRDRK